MSYSMRGVGGVTSFWMLPFFFLSSLYLSLLFFTLSSHLHLFDKHCRGLSVCLSWEGFDASPALQTGCLFSLSESSCHIDRSTKGIILTTYLAWLFIFHVYSLHVPSYSIGYCDSGSLRGGRGTDEGKIACSIFVSIHICWPTLS